MGHPEYGVAVYTCIGVVLLLMWLVPPTLFAVALMLKMYSSRKEVRWLESLDEESGLIRERGPGRVWEYGSCSSDGTVSDMG